MLALSGYKLAHYMGSRLNSTVDSAEFARGEWIFVEHPFPQARNANFVAIKLTEKDHRGYFFKQPLASNGVWSALYNESVFYESFVKHSVLAPHLLEIIHFDYSNNILVLEYRQESVVFPDHLAMLPNPRNPADGTLRLIATHSLAQMLKLFRNELSIGKLTGYGVANSAIDKICFTDKLKKNRCFKTFLPWILSLTDEDLLRFNQSSVDQVKQFARLLYGKDPDGFAVDGLQGESSFELRLHTERKGLRNEFKELRENWKISHLINADAHLTNIIVSESDKLYFIDWEYAAWGDPYWDFAGILSGYFTMIRAENPVLSEEEVISHVRMLCSTYFREVEELFRQDALKTCIQYAGLWLLSEYYLWATSDEKSGNSIYQDKFRLGKICVLDPGQIINDFNL